eukprot:2731710-Pleurochrysis_carterae.AAC.1
MPSGRLNSPENRRSTERDIRAGRGLSGTSRGMSWIRAASLAGGSDLGNPGGTDATGEVAGGVVGFQGKAASKIDAYPGARVTAGFGVCDARFDGECTASEGKYGHDAWLRAREDLIGRQGNTRRAGGPVEYIDGMRDR